MLILKLFQILTILCTGRHLYAEKLDVLAEMRKTKSREVFCSGGSDYEIVGTFYAPSALIVVVYDIIAREHIFYILSENLVTNHIQYSSLYLKYTARASMMELFNYDPAVNDSLKIQNMRSIAIPEGTVEHEDGYRRALIITYENANFLHSIKFRNGTEIEAELEQIDVSGDIKRLGQEFVLSSDDTGFQITYDQTTSEWFVNDVEEYDGKVWPIGPINYIGFVKSMGISFVAFLPVTLKKPDEFDTISAGRILGFVEPSNRRIVLFIDSKVYILRDMLASVKHNFAYVMIYEQLDYRQFFSCQPYPSHQMFGGIKVLGAARLDIITAIFYGVVMMAILILCYAIYKAVIWHIELDRIQMKKRLKARAKRMRMRSRMLLSQSDYGMKMASMNGSRLEMRSMPVRSDTMLKSQVQQTEQISEIQTLNQ